MRHTCSRFSGSAAAQPRCRVGLSPATAPAPPRVLLPLNTPKLRYGGALPVTHGEIACALGPQAHLQAPINLRHTALHFGGMS